MPLLLTAVLAFGAAWIIKNQSPALANAIVAATILVVITMLILGPSAGTGLFLLFLMIGGAIALFFLLPYILGAFLVFVLFIGLIMGLDQLVK